MIRFAFQGILYVGERIASEIALLASILSVVHDGALLQRALGGIGSIFATLQGFYRGYMANEALQAVFRTFTQAVQEALQRAEKNIETDPQGVLIAFLGTFVGLKLIAFILRLCRRSLRRRMKFEHAEPVTGE